MVDWFLVGNIFEWAIGAQLRPINQTSSGQWPSQICLLRPKMAENMSLQSSGLQSPPVQFVFLDLEVLSCLGKWLASTPSPTTLIYVLGSSHPHTCSKWQSTIYIAVRGYDEIGSPQARSRSFVHHAWSSNSSSCILVHWREDYKIKTTSWSLTGLRSQTIFPWSMAPTRLKPGLLESTYQRKQHLIKCLVDLQAHGFPHEIHIGKNLCKRFRTYVKQYKDTLEAKHSSGGGLTLAGFEVGMTLPEKNEQVVPFFWLEACYSESPSN